MAAIVTQEMVRELSAGAQTTFAETFASQAGAWREIATLVDSTQQSEDYAWLAQLPLMREFSDERVIKALSSYGYTIRNRKFEMTLAVEREVLEDEQYGHIRMRIESMAEAASAHYDQMLFALIASGQTALCYDGKPFYADSHAVGGQTVANLTDLPFSANALETVLTTMARVPLDNGEPMLVTPTHLLVPPELAFEARRVLGSLYYTDAAGPGAPGALSRNPLLGALQIIVSARINTPQEWHVLDCAHSVKPFLIQQRIAPEFSALDGAEGSESETAFLRDIYLYGVRSRDNAGFGLWQYGFKSTGDGS